MAYELRETLPTPERFRELRAAAGMAERSREGVEQGLPNSVYGVTIVEQSSGETVGMARIVGDGGSVYHICDMAVHPDHQRQGLGSQMMDTIMSYVDEHASENAYVNLMADVDGFYELRKSQCDFRERQNACSDGSGASRRRGPRRRGCSTGRSYAVSKASCSMT